MSGSKLKPGTQSYLFKSFFEVHVTFLLGTIWLEERRPFDQQHDMPKAGTRAGEAETLFAPGFPS